MKKYTRLNTTTYKDQKVEISQQLGRFVKKHPVFIIPTWPPCAASKREGTMFFKRGGRGALP